MAARAGTVGHRNRRGGLRGLRPARHLLPRAATRRKSGIGNRQIVREDALLLYGFATLAEKQAVDLLMVVQHVGAKLALVVQSVLSPQELAAAVAQEDVERLDAVPGVDAKVAERIVREPRDKISGLNLIAPERPVAPLGPTDRACQGRWPMMPALKRE
jgi:holliday junction DNA helicase RuvA